MSEEEKTEKTEITESAPQENAGHKAKQLPKRVSDITLPAKWLVQTCALAKKYGTGLAITKNGSVCGFKGGYARNVVYYFPPDEEWVKTVLSLAPDGANFPTASAIVGGTDAVKSIRVYANLKIDDKSVAKIDRTTLAVSVNGIGMRVRNGILSPDTIDDIPPCDCGFEDFKLPPFDRCAELLEENCDSRCYKKELRTINVVNFSDGTRWLISMNSSSMFTVKTDTLPKNLIIDKDVTDIKEIVGYSQDNGNENSEYVDNTFKLRDGVCVRLRSEKPSGRIEFDKIIPSDISDYTKVKCADVREILDDINTLGFNTIDRDSVVKITNTGITLTVNGEEVANFERDGFKDIKPNHSISFKTTFLKRIANCGKDFFVSTSDWLTASKPHEHLARMKEDGAVCIVMPCVPDVHRE